MTNSTKPRATQPERAAQKDKLRLWLRLLRTTRHVEAEVRERLRLQFGTTLPRFDVMSALARSGTGLTMGMLSRELLVSNGNVTGIIERLVADGQVLRVTTAKDRRTTLVRLTPQGAQQFEEMAVVHEAWIAEILGDIAPADVAVIMPLLAKVSAIAKSEPES